MPFTGFTSETGEFLWELAFHNEKPWFEAHKEQFLHAVKEPFDALAKETLALMRQKHPDEPYCLHISRIYRDARITSIYELIGYHHDHSVFRYSNIKGISRIIYLRLIFSNQTSICTVKINPGIVSAIQNRSYKTAL